MDWHSGAVMKANPKEKVRRAAKVRAKGKGKGRSPNPGRVGAQPEALASIGLWFSRGSRKTVLEGRFAPGLRDGSDDF